MLFLSAQLRQSQQAFQIATQTAFLEIGDVIEQLVDDPELTGEEARALGGLVWQTATLARSSFRTWPS